MFAEIIKSVLEALKLAPRYLVAVAAITALLLFLPEDWLKFLSIAALSILITSVIKTVNARNPANERSRGPCARAVLRTDLAV